MTRPRPARVCATALGAAWALGFAGPSRADPAPVRWSSAAYVAAVLAASPEVEQARQLAAAADSSWKADLSDSVLPSLSFSANAYPWGNNPLNSYLFNSWRLARRETSVNAGLAWNLFNSFADTLKVRYSYSTREMSRRDLEKAMQDSALKAVRGYCDLRLQETLLEVARADLQTHQEQYRQTQDLYRHGMKSLSDLLKTETDVRSSELRQEGAEADRALALYRFNALLGLHPEAPALIDPESPPFDVPLPALASDLRRAALDRPDMARLRTESERAKTALQQSLQGASPSLSFGYQYNYQEFGSFGLPSSQFGIRNPNQYMSLTLSLPLGFNFASQYLRVRAARQSRSSIESAHQAIERSVRDEVFSARVALGRSQRSFQISARKETISRRNLELVIEQYRQGSADVIRLSQAQLDHLNAQVERMQAIHDTDISRAQYRVAVGEPLWR